MQDKIRILFHSKDAAGVNYFRTQTPAIQLERDHSDKFYVEINPNLDFSTPESTEKTVEYLKSFHIVHYHRTIVAGIPQMLKLANELKSAGVTLIADIDDYWLLDKSHPFYLTSIESKMHEDIMDNLKIANYVTTTTDLFAEEIRKVTGKNNVIVLPNSVDPIWMKQFQNDRKPDPDGLVRITYAAGSSHKHDVEQLNGVINMLQADSQTKNKYKIILAGWDTEGTTTDVTFNQKFAEEMKKRKLWTKDIVKAVNKTRGNVDMIPNIPSDIKENFRGKVFTSNKRKIKSEESVYLQYEKILTDNYKLILDQEYIKWLENYERNKYENEGNYARRWTQKANIYATVLNETDISIAPLADHMFNRMKCVVGDTLISTNKGIFKIKDIVNNKITNLKIDNNNIVNYFKYNNEKTLKFKTNIGLEIEGTKTHRLFVNNKWKSMKDFNIGDEIEINQFHFENYEYQKLHYPMLLSKKITNIIIENAEKNIIPSILINEDYGRFFGYMIGDGNFSSNYLRISCDKRYTDVVDDIVNLGKKIGLSPFLISNKIDKRCKNTISKDGFGIDVQLTSKHLSNICVQENLKNENGKVFEVPHFILKSPKSVIKQFLRGLFEADGTVSTEGSFVSLTSKSLFLIKQIQYLLIGFGIISKIQIAPNKRYKKNYYNLRLNRNATNIFYKEIGFVSSIKQNKLKKITEKSHSNRYKEQSFKLEIIEIIENNNDVYDIEVENIHLYNGNGLINHNSNLKQVECWSRKIPIICTDVPPYNVDGINGENCLLVPNKKNIFRYWYKALKKLILSEDLRNQIGQGLHDTFKDKYNLKNVTNNRANFYESVVKEALKV